MDNKKFIIVQDGKTYNLYDLPKGFVINTNVDIRYCQLTELPNLSDVVVNGDFDCSCNELASLNGAPKIIHGSFKCTNNELRSLESAPEQIDGDFDCSSNKIKSLIGGPKIVGGEYCCYHNKLKNLEGAPKKVYCIDFSLDNPIKSLKGSPEIVEGDFKCEQLGLTSLEGAPKKVGGTFDCWNNELTDLKGAPEEIGGNFICSCNKLKTLEGGPKKVGGNFVCTNNTLRNLKGSPETVGDGFECNNNCLTSLEGAPRKIGTWFAIAGNYIETKEALDCLSECFGMKIKETKNLPEILGLKSLEGIPEQYGKNARFICDNLTVEEYGFMDKEKDLTSTLNLDYEDVLDAVIEKHGNRPQTTPEHIVTQKEITVKQEKIIIKEQISEKQAKRKTVKKPKITEKDFSKCPKTTFDSALKKMFIGYLHVIIGCNLKKESDIEKYSQHDFSKEIDEAQNNLYKNAQTWLSEHPNNNETKTIKQYVLYMNWTEFLNGCKHMWHPLVTQQKIISDANKVNQPELEQYIQTGWANIGQYLKEINSTLSSMDKIETINQNKSKQNTNNKVR